MSRGPSSASAALTAAPIESSERTSISKARAVHLAGHGRGPVEVHVGHGHARALGRQAATGGGADSRGATRDQRCAVRESQGGLRLPVRVRGHEPRRAAGAPLIALLSGGTGGAKLARGVADLEDLVVIANTGDDAEVYGVHVSPDPDLVTYWLAGEIDERGYGLRGDTFEVVGALERAGRPAWFRLGDRDLAMCLIRTELMRSGASLTEAHDAVVSAMGVDARVLPMCDEPVTTWVRSPRGTAPVPGVHDRGPGRGAGRGRGAARAGARPGRPTRCWPPWPRPRRS